MPSAGLGLYSALLMAAALLSFPATSASAALYTDTTAPRIRLKIDTSNADATLKLLGAEASPADLARFKALPATADLIRRARGWNMKLTPDDLVSMLAKAKAGEKKNLFSYDGVFAKTDEIRDLISRIRSNQTELERYLNVKLAPFLPVGKNLDLTSIVLLGGSSAGFVMGSPDTMYTGAHLYDGDFVGYRTGLLHEAFHNVQIAVLPQRDLNTCLSKEERAAYNALERVFKEGSAEYVADLWSAENDSPYNARMRKNMEANNNSWRLQSIERLLNHIVVSAVDVADRQPDPEVLSIILTDWNWNNPGYYYGYRMSHELAKQHGPARISHYLRQGPQAFFKDYLALKKSGSSNFFGPRFTEIVDTLDTKVQGCSLKKS